MTNDDVRRELLDMLRDHFGITLEPRGSSLDVVQSVGWKGGTCADPVIVRLPTQWVVRFAEDNGVDVLATLISEEMETVSASQLIELEVGPDGPHGACLKPTRR